MKKKRTWIVRIVALLCVLLLLAAVFAVVLTTR